MKYLALPFVLVWKAICFYCMLWTPRPSARIKAEDWSPARVEFPDKPMMKWDRRYVAAYLATLEEDKKQEAISMLVVGDGTRLWERTNHCIMVGSMLVFDNEEDMVAFKLKYGGPSGTTAPE